MTLHPAHVLAVLWFWLSDQVTPQEVQRHSALRICMRRGEDFIADPDVDVELFPNLPGEAGGQRLARFALATRKLPIAFEVDPFWPARDQELIVALDNRRGHDDGGHGRP